MSNRKELRFEMVGECKICVSHTPKTNGGYIRYTLDGKTERLHRIIWEQEVGKIPEGYEISHTCGDRRCMNVNHMECLSKKQRGEKMSESGNSLRGEKSLRAKLTADDVINIVNDKKHSTSFLAQKYGITEQHVNDLKAKRYWKHLWK